MEVLNRTGYVTLAQKGHLIDIIDNYPKLVSGKFSATFTRKEAQKQWKENPIVLNAIRGATKTWMQ